MMHGAYSVKLCKLFVGFKIVTQIDIINYYYYYYILLTPPFINQIDKYRIHNRISEGTEFASLISTNPQKFWRDFVVNWPLLFDLTQSKHVNKCLLNF